MVMIKLSERGEERRRRRSLWEKAGFYAYPPSLWNVDWEGAHPACPEGRSNTFVDWEREGASMEFTLVGDDLVYSTQLPPDID